MSMVPETIGQTCFVHDAPCRGTIELQYCDRRIVDKKNKNISYQYKIEAGRGWREGSHKAPDKKPQSPLNPDARREVNVTCDQSWQQSSLTRRKHWHNTIKMLQVYTHPLIRAWWCWKNDTSVWNYRIKYPLMCTCRHGSHLLEENHNRFMWGEPMPYN